MLSQASNEENNRIHKRTGIYRESVSPWSCFLFCLSLCMSLGNSVYSKPSISTASWCSVSEAFHKAVLVLQSLYTLWAGSCGAKSVILCPEVRALPCKQQLCALANASIPLFKEAKAILPSTGPETSLTANVSWTKSLLVPSGAL